MSDGIEFALVHEGQSQEEEVKVELRAPTNYGARIAASFHMTRSEFLKFVADGYRYFELNQAHEALGLELVDLDVLSAAAAFYTKSPDGQYDRHIVQLLDKLLEE